MDADYDVVDQAIDEMDGLARGMEGLVHRLDQYEAAEETGALPADMEDMDEMRDEIRAYFSDALPHHREVASWGYMKLEAAIDDLEHDLRNPREAGFTPETMRAAKQTYHDAMQLENHYFSLLKEATALDRRAAELIGPEVVAQAKEEARDAPYEPGIPAAPGGAGNGTSIPVDDAPDDTDTGTDGQTELGDF